VVEPGDPAQSLLLRRVKADGVPPMPPAGPPLTPGEIGALASWIDQGARPRFDAPPARPNWRPRMALAKPAAPSPDALLDAYWKRRGLAPPPPVGDAAFARRAYLDAWGLLPLPEQLDAFLADRTPDRRQRLVSRLLADNKAYAEHWITFWNDLLRNDEGVVYHGTRKTITGWLYKALEDNLPYDRFVRALLNPAGPGDPDGFLIGVNWRGDINASQTPVMQAAQNTAQIFLGVNLKCNSCHDSFISRWKLKDAYGLAGFFSEEKLEMVRCDARLGVYAEPAFLFPELGGPGSASTLAERRAAAASLFTKPENGRFARTIANRIWKRLLGLGIVEPADDMDAEPWDPFLLDWLAADLVEHGYDLKRLIGVIMTSRAYQLPAAPRQKPGEYVFRGPEARRLTAEQFMDALSSITGEWRARIGAQAGEAEYVRDWRLASTRLSRALGRPIRDQVFTGRSEEATTLQALELTNGDVLARFLRRASQRMLGALEPAPPNLFDSGRVGANLVKADIDLTGAAQLRLLAIDVDSYSPERVVAWWADARWISPRGAFPVSEKPEPVRMKDASFDGGIRVTGFDKGPVELVFDIAGKGYTRFQATAGVEEASLASDINPKIRFFAFSSKPDLDLLVRVRPETPVPAPKGPFTVRTLSTRLFRHALSRDPSPAERAALAAAFPGGRLTAPALADVLWALAAQPEFQLIQ
jgi:hypothetical protein